MQGQGCLGIYTSPTTSDQAKVPNETSIKECGRQQDQHMFSMQLFITLRVQVLPVTGLWVHSGYQKSVSKDYLDPSGNRERTENHTLISYPLIRFAQRHSELKSFCLRWLSCNDYQKLLEPAFGRHEGRLAKSQILKPQTRLTQGSRKKQRGWLSQEGSRETFRV